MNFNIAKSFKRLFTFHRKEKEILSEKVIQKDKTSVKKPVPETGSGGHKVKMYPAWWKRLYNVQKRNQVGSLHRHCLRHFGNFSPVNGVKKTNHPIEIRTKGRYSLPFRPLDYGPYIRED